jgi:hypothetical protein
VYDFEICEILTFLHILELKIHPKKNTNFTTFIFHIKNMFDSLIIV